MLKQTGVETAPRNASANNEAWTASFAGVVRLLVEERERALSATSLANESRTRSRVVRRLYVPAIPDIVH